MSPNTVATSVSVQPPSQGTEGADEKGKEHLNGVAEDLPVEKMIRHRGALFP